MRQKDNESELLDVGVRGRLTKLGAKDIEILIVSIHNDGSPPYAVITDEKLAPLVAGEPAASLGEALDKEAAKHRGYKIEERLRIVCVVPRK